MQAQKGLDVGPFWRFAPVGDWSIIAGFTDDLQEK